MNVLVIAGPRLLARGSPRHHSIHLLADALGGFFPFFGRGDRRCLLDFLQECLDVAAVTKQDLIKLLERASHSVKQSLALLHSTEPVSLQQLANLALHFLLLAIEAALAPLDPTDEITYGDSQRCNYL
jgi:hypothetical protein